MGNDHSLLRVKKICFFDFKQIRFVRKYAKNYRNEGGYMTQKQGRKNKLPDLFEPLQQDLLHCF